MTKDNQPSNSRRALVILFVVATVTVAIPSPVAATVAGEAPQTQPPHPDTRDHAAAVQPERCGTVENVTLTNVTFSIDIANGTVDGLEIDGETTDASIMNGSLLLDEAELFVEEAAVTEDGLVLESDAIAIVSGGFFLQNATATVDDEAVSVDNERFTAESDDGVTVSGVDRISGSPARLLGESSMGALTLFDLSDDLRFDSASHEALGVVQMTMDDVELSDRPLQPTFEDVTVSNGELTATSVVVPVEDADLSIGELAVTAEGVTSRSDDVDAEIEGETVEFEDVTLEQAQLPELLDAAC